MCISEVYFLIFGEVLENVYEGNKVENFLYGTRGKAKALGNVIRKDE